MKVLHFDEKPDEPTPDPKEASDWKWVDVETLARDMRAHPDRYAPWFRIAQEKMLPYLGAAF